MLQCVSEQPSAKWRNWQTHQTQNLANLRVRVGSTPTFATIQSLSYSIEMTFRVSYALGVCKFAKTDTKGWLP